MFLEILKNPIVLGLFAGTVAYLYLLWDNERKNKTKNKGNKGKKDINLMIPLIVSVVICVMSYAYFYSSSDTRKASIDLTETLNIKNTGDKVKFAFSDGDDNLKQSNDDSVAEFHLISKGLNIPNKAVPEVFMETFS